ncbi:MAG: hypothetical protein OEZ22_04150 [Spirochaetia bacterium]|nr:hypothetical protein [Spirochaetia bacterium]
MKYYISQILLVLGIIFLSTTALYAKTLSKDLNKKAVINIDGSIGIGFYETSPGANSGGLNLNVDVLFFKLWGLHCGGTTGYLSLSENKMIDNYSKSNAIPIGFMMAVIFQKNSWNSIPYINMAPSLFLMRDEKDDKKENNLGIGGSIGTGIMIPVASKLFIDLAMRVHYIHTGEIQYPMLTSNIGISVAF